MRTSLLALALPLLLVATAALADAPPASGGAAPPEGTAALASAGSAASAGAASAGDAASAGAAAGAGGVIAPCPAGGAANSGGDVDDTSLSGRVKGALAAGNILLALLLVFGGGLLTALSPCVYPLIPITLSVLGARQAASHVKGFLLAATYVSGMVILYSGLGVGFAAFGFLAGSALQSPVVTIGVALFCIAMSASMFGAFEFALPSGLQTRLTQATSGSGSGFRGAFLMGLVAGIIAAPCTGPVLSFILTLIARDGSIAKGALLMVAYALGMGAPFLVLGTFSQAVARMPKSGRWMEIVKSVFGLLMIGAGLYYLHIASPALARAIAPLAAFAWLGPVLLVVGVVVGVLQLSFKMGSAGDKLRKSFGLASSVVGIAAFVAWATSSPEATTEGTGASAIAWNIVKGGTDDVARVDQALAAAKRACKPAMIDFFAEWCVACKELDHKTYPDVGVRQEAARFAAIKVDATDDSPALDTLRKRYKVDGLPTVLFVDGRGDVVNERTITGFVDANEMHARLARTH